jgi:hypothetical protein
MLIYLQTKFQNSLLVIGITPNNRCLFREPAMLLFYIIKNLTKAMYFSMVSYQTKYQDLIEVALMELPIVTVAMLALLT